MKYVFKLLTIIALVAVIGFSIITCDNGMGGGNGDGGTGGGGSSGTGGSGGIDVGTGGGGTGDGIGEGGGSKTLVSIAVTTPPTKTVYAVGEAIDLSGLVVTAIYSDSSTGTLGISIEHISGFNSSTTGSKTVTINYGGKTATFTVTVNSNSNVVFTSIASFTTWLNVQPDNTVATTYNVKLNVSNLGSSYDSESVRNTLLANATKYVNLDLSNSTITGIYKGTFYECTNLTGITIPNSVIIIEGDTFGGGAFAKCTSLTSVIIPNNVNSIGENAFWDCINLASVTIGNSVTSISSFAFDGCTKLSNITIPDSVTVIGADAFNDTIWLNNQPNGVVYAGKVAYTYKGTMPANTSITLPNGTKGIASFAFAGCTNLSNITIPDSVINILNNAFVSTGLTYVVIPNSVTSIGEAAFAGCTKLASIVIPNSITNIFDQTFYGCTSLSSIIIHDSVTRIGGRAFSGCSSLANVTIGNNVTSIGFWAFENCTSLTGINFTPTSKVTTIYAAAFDGCTSLTSITIPASVTRIEQSTFYKCTSLTSVTFATGSNITSFGVDVFPEGSNGYGGDSLRNVYLTAATKAGTYTRVANGSTWTKQ